MTKETTINRFDGGIVSDPRSEQRNICRFTGNFDILTNPHKLTPYRDSEDGDAAAANNDIRAFQIAKYSGSTHRLYGLGLKSGASTAKVFHKDLSTSASSDLDDSSWAEFSAATSESGSGAPSRDLFIYFRALGKIYGARAGTHIWAFDPAGVAAFDDTHSAVTYTEINQGIVHPKDGFMYIPYFNDGGYISRNNGSGFNHTALSLPIFLNPVSICDYGNFLAILCAPISGIGNSYLYLWDRDVSNALLDDMIDCGTEQGRLVEEIDGELVVISQAGNSTLDLVPRVVFRRVIGNKAERFEELRSTATVTVPLSHKAKRDGRLYFLMTGTFAGEARGGLWSVGRNGVGAPLSIAFERPYYNDNAATNTTLRGFGFVGDYTFISSVTSGTIQMSKTNDQATYSATSIYETKIFNTEGSSKKKDLMGVSVTTEYLPSAGQVVLKYRTDHNTSWTTIFTLTTDNAISYSVPKSSGLLVGDYKEIQFRIESTGGAEITGLQFTENVTGKRTYD